MKKIFLGAIFFLLVVIGYSQEFRISAEIRPRLEVRKGFKNLALIDSKAAMFTSQRSRINLLLHNNNEKIKLGLSLQNVRVWGDVNTLSAADKNGIAMHEAWAELLINNNFSIKTGRQEIIYDDHRIFGSVDWAQQARSHDALIAKYRKGDHKLDFGIAYNANGETLFKEDYTVNNYKAFQYIWYHTKIQNDLSLSILALNNGLPYDNSNDTQETAYSQTIGPRLSFSKDKIGADITFYYQSGNVAEVDLKAVYFAYNFKYKINAYWKFHIGAEYLSGTDMNSTDTELNSFTPLYGTNHKFNGFMDYFYVGNHINSVGLTDIYAGIHYKKKGFSANFIPHLFSSPSVIVNDSGVAMDSKLGTEFDFTFGYKVSKSVSIKSGYSRMFATESLGVLKSRPSDESNHWFWLSLIVKSELFSNNNEK